MFKALGFVLEVLLSMVFFLFLVVSFCPGYYNPMTLLFVHELKLIFFKLNYELFSAKNLRIHT